MLREIVQNHDIAFSNRPRSTAAKALFYGCTDFGFTPYGEYWRQVRKISFVNLLSLRKVEWFQFVRDEEVEELINKIRRASVKSESINLSEMLMAVSTNIVSRCVFGKKLSGEEDKFGELSRRISVLMLSFCVGDMFPYLRWMDLLTGFIPSLKQVSRELDVLFDKLIKDIALELEDDDDDEDDIKKDDFVSTILRLQRDGLLEMDLNIKAILVNMFVGGADTTSTTIEWVMAELMKHPNVMKKVQEEVRNVVGKGKGNKSKVMVNAEDINKMEYLKCVIKETLRIHPPAPLAPRETMASVKLGGYDIPANITVFINSFAIHRDPNWWDDPEEFIPERFENSSVDYKGQDLEFIPFGYGRRGCPGILFGIATLQCVMANLVYWFDWKLPAGEIPHNLDMTELNGLAIKKKRPLHVLPLMSHLSSFQV
ncbi:Cytochrome P450 [Corchorus capsularis]|uniref:Cytochrome P450 n=1 Tax=Corchorus capsularis TaxID=210143 RepID=A0A1R3HBI9_COCAP|nr:Cytochrome P450 [Corchorus capsularis]